MINDWKIFFKAQGFEKIDRRDFLRPAMPVSALIYETPLRVGQREVRLNVAVEIHDPWLLEREYHVLHFRGDITSEGIYVNFDETPRWIHPDKKDQVFAVIQGCLMEWVKQWSEPRHLIQYFEHPVDIVMTRPLPDSQGCEHVFGVPATRRVSPHKNYLLSLLYYHVGDLQKALAAAQSYYQFVESRTAYEGEPERTRRQIEQLSSQLR